MISCLFWLSVKVIALSWAEKFPSEYSNNWFLLMRKIVVNYYVHVLKSSLRISSQSHANKSDIPHVYCRSKIKEKFTKWVFFLVDSPEQISWGNLRLAFVNSWLDRFFSMITDLLWIKRVIRLAVKVPAILKQLFDFVLFDCGVSSSFISYCSLCTRSI